MIIILTPFIPLSFKGEGGRLNKEGLSPLLDTLTNRVIIVEERTGGELKWIILSFG